MATYGAALRPSSSRRRTGLPGSSVFTYHRIYSTTSSTTRDERTNEGTTGLNDFEGRRINEPLSILHGARVPRVAAYPRRRSVGHLFARLNQRERASALARVSRRYRAGIAQYRAWLISRRRIGVELADTSSPRRRQRRRRRRRQDVAVAAIEKSTRFLSLSLISRTLRRVIRAVLGAFENAMSRDVE